MTISAADVKRLREDTDAPMMECKRALETAGGDYDKAKQILREAGSAAAAKRAGRATSEGIAKIVVSEDGKTAAAVVVECETDFVSGNEDFKALVAKIADGFLAAGSATADTKVGDHTAQEHIEEAVGKIRENIRIAAGEIISAGTGKIAAYNHHDGKWAAWVEYTGDNGDNAKHVATQVVAFKPEYLKKDDVPSDIIEAEIATETQRAVNEGKPQAQAENIAKGRVNKFFYQEKVLLEQNIYTDGKTNVAEFAKSGGAGDILGYGLFYVGGNSGGTDSE